MSKSHLTTDILLSEIARKIKISNQDLCCIKNSVSDPGTAGNKYVIGAKADVHTCGISFVITPGGTSLVTIDVPALVFGPDPVASNVDTAIEYYLILPDCTRIDLMGSLGGSSTPINYSDYPMGPLTIKLVLRTALNFEQVYTAYNVNTGSVFHSNKSNSNNSVGIVSGLFTYYTNFLPYYAAFDVAGNVNGFKDMVGNPIVNFGINQHKLFTECPPPLELRCNTECEGTPLEKVFGITVAGNTTTMPPIINGVTSLTVDATIGDVTVVINSGTLTVRQGTTYTFSKGNNTYLNVNGWTFKGSLPGSLYNVYGDYI